MVITARRRLCIQALFNVGEKVHDAWSFEHWLDHLRKGCVKRLAIQGAVSKKAGATVCTDRWSY